MARITRDCALVDAQKSFKELREIRTDMSHYRLLVEVP